MKSPVERADIPIVRDTGPILNGDQSPIVSYDRNVKSYSGIADGILTVLSDDPGRFSTIVTFYGTVIILSLVGNLLVFRTVLSKCARNSTNYLILNLALSDILMTVMNIPITVIDILLHDWPFGRRLCILVPFLQACCVYVSSFTMLTIALNRYYLVYYSRSKASTYLRPPASSASAAAPMSGNTNHGRASLPGPVSISVPATDPLHSRLRRPSAMQTLARGLTSRRWLPSKLWSLPAAIWALAVLHSVPFANNHVIMISTMTPASSSSSLSSSAGPDDGTGTTLRRCISADVPFDELTLTIFVFVTQYLFPLVISGAIYLRIGVTISRLGHVLHTSIRVRRAAAATTPITVSSSTAGNSSIVASLSPSTGTVSGGPTITTTFTQRFSSGALNLPRLSTTMFASNSSELVTPTRSSSNSGLPGCLNADEMPSNNGHRPSNGLTRKEAILVRKRRRILLLTLIVTIFAGCWLPFHIYYLLKDFRFIRTNERVFLMCHWLAMSSVCYNPIVYFWLNDSFRSEVKTLISRFCDFRCRILSPEQSSEHIHHTPLNHHYTFHSPTTQQQPQQQ